MISAELKSYQMGSARTNFFVEIEVELEVKVLA